MATIWSTKYALSTGIEKHDDVEIKDGYAKKGTLLAGHVFLRIGKDAWLTEAEAKKRAVQMAANRLTALKREEKKLHAFIVNWSI